jgi:protein SCO1/2
VRAPPSCRRLAGGLALAACLAAGGCGSARNTTVTFDGAALTQPPQAPGFTLTDLEGRRVSLSSLRGRVVVLAFLDSACAPGCVLVAQQIRGALDELAKAPAVLLVSVDPAADTPARVRGFLRAVSLDGRVRYLAGPAAALRGVWREYRIVSPHDGRAAFERALTVVLVDRQGRERVLYQPEQLTPEALAHDIRALE